MKTKTLTIVVETAFTDTQIRSRIYDGMMLHMGIYEVGTVRRLVGIDKHDPPNRKPRVKAKGKPRVGRGKKR